MLGSDHLGLPAAHLEVGVMTREWKPGDIIDAFVSSRNSRRVLVFLGARGGEWPWRLLDSGSPDMNGIGASNVRDARLAIPELAGLVVIDPEDREAVERLTASIYDAATDRPYVGGAADGVQAALREFADPKPPKPDEPTGLGALAKCRDGRVWVRTDWSTWRCISDADVAPETYDHLDVAEVRQGWSE